MAYDASFRVWRGDDTGGELRDFTVEVRDGEVVLDIIHRLQATQAPDLAVRWNCKAGKCGSCSAEVNGKPRLMCMTRMSTFDATETVTVTPMRAFPIVRDLVTDVSFNYEKAREVPSFTPPPDLAPGEYRMAQIDVERSQEFRKCIECYLCQNTCHVIRDHEENKPRYSGPRFFIRIAELDMHPLDVRDRRRAAQDEAGLGYCNITKCCTEVCPEGIHITDNGIIPMKERVVDAKYDPVFVVGARIPTRSDRPAAEALQRGDSREAEDLARRRLLDKPSDQAAFGVLTQALFNQGRFAEAAASAQERIGLVGSRGKHRRDASTELAWSLLCAVEAGQIEDDAQVRATVHEQMLTASRLTGSVLIAHKEALHQLYLGDTARAQREIDQVLDWHRPADERADALLTKARLLGAAGDTSGAAATLAAARSLAPANPRLGPVGELLAQP
jgi:succinate dehydrogenase / fumarate reductase, iron-sulfur subunit